jgi:hypothetical protein
MDEIRARINLSLRKYSVQTSALRPEQFILRDLLGDSDTYEEFVGEISREFDMQIPEVGDMANYKRELRKAYGFHISDFFRTKPTIFVPDLTVMELADIVRQNVWPREYLLPS